MLTLTNQSTPTTLNTNHSFDQSYQDTDWPTVQRARAGDSTAFEALWAKYQPDLYAYFRRQVNHSEEAEDMASETLLAAFKQLSTFRGVGYAASVETEEAGPYEHSLLSHPQCTFRTFLYAIARHKIARWIRSKKSHACYGFSELEMSEAEEEESNPFAARLKADEESDPLRALLRQENLDEVCYALADVGMRSAEQFKALFFHYFCDLPHKEVAALLDTRSETVNTRLQEGRRTLVRHYRRALQGHNAVTC
jgi:RNA polymerase sigma factor (sigma-70 family)